jgi:prevent-host-death family protein
MQTVSETEFQLKCLELIDEVSERGEELIITKDGKPVSVLMPYKEKPKTLFGLHRSIIRTNDDLIEPMGVDWEADAAD